MNEYQKKMVEGLERLLEMPDEELLRRIDESTVTEEEARKFAKLERLVFRNEDAA